MANVLWFCSAPKWNNFSGIGACRRCPGCLRQRTREWVSRAFVERGAAARTWFCTFTYRGDVAPGYADFQRYLKRLRKHAACRYLVVVERGSEAGRLHFHALLHGGADLTKRVIEGPYKLGFTRVKLTKGNEALRYVAKYSTKEGRLRASVGYGTRTFPEFQSVYAAANPLVQAVFAHFPGAVISRVGGQPVPWQFRRRSKAAAPVVGRAWFGVRPKGDGVEHFQRLVSDDWDSDLGPAPFNADI